MLNLHRSRTDIQRRQGLTLFEVLLSLAVLAVSLAAIGQLVSSGMRGAVQAHLQSEAVIRCQHQLGELMATCEAIPNLSEQPFPDDSNWTWSASSSDTEENGLVSVVVTVKHSAGNGIGEVSYSLVLSLLPLLRFQTTTHVRLRWSTYL